MRSRLGRSRILTRFAARIVPGREPERRRRGARPVRPDPDRTTMHDLAFIAAGLAFFAAAAGYAALCNRF